MPSRKSNVSVVSNGTNEEPNIEHTPTTSKTVKDGISIDDLSLPKSMIARLAKGVLPPNTQIHKDALLALHKSATVFVSYIASNANELAQASGKKTIAPPDVFGSLRDAELEFFIPRLEAELKKYNEMQCDKRNSYRHRVKQEKTAAAAITSTTVGDDATLPDAPGDSTGVVAGLHDQDRPQKKQKGPDGDVIMLSEDGPDDDELLDAQLNADNAAIDDSDVPDDEIDEEEGVDDEEDEEEDGEALVDPAGGGVLRDEALDDPESD